MWWAGGGGGIWRLGERAVVGGYCGEVVLSCWDVDEIKQIYLLLRSIYLCVRGWWLGWTEMDGHFPGPSWETCGGGVSSYHIEAYRFEVVSMHAPMPTDSFYRLEST